MSNEWFNKAKEAALNAAESAKDAALNAAENAKNANLGEMLDKTKNMALEAAEEAKKAAGAVLGNEHTTQSHVAEKSPPTKEELLQVCNTRLVKIEAMLQQIKDQIEKLK